MRHLILATLVLVSGCTRYANVERDLVTQSRRAIERATISTNDRALVVETYHALLREQLDDAFDMDVRERSSLTADWIIESRRAYAAALDALHQQHEASEQATANDLTNLTSADEALQKLDWLLSLQSNWITQPQQENK